MAIDQQQMTALQNQSSGLTATNKQLSSIQTALQQLSARRQGAGLGRRCSPTPRPPPRPTPRSSRRPPRPATGAVIGSYQVGVTHLASVGAADVLASPARRAADTVTIDGQQISLNAGASAQDLVNAVNYNNNVDVWATATDPGTVVFSNRATGDTGDELHPGVGHLRSLTEQTALAQQGANAAVHGQRRRAQLGFGHDRQRDPGRHPHAQRPYDHERHR